MGTMVGTRLEKPSDQSVGARYESLIRLADSIRAQHEPNALFRVMVDELSAVIPFDAIAQYDESSKKVNWHFCESCEQSSPRPSEGQIEETLAWWVCENQQAAVIADAWQESRFLLTAEQLKKAGLRSACALPLSTAHRRLGSLVIASQKLDAYSEEEVRFLSLVAGQIALAMDDAFNFQASRRAQERLELLLDLTNRVVSTLDLRDLLRVIAANLRRVMQSDAVGMELPDADGKLRLYALDFPAGDDLIREGFEPTADSTAVQVFRTGEPILDGVRELASDPIAGALGIRSVCHLPLTSRSRILGVLSVGRLRESAFSGDDVTFLTQFAKQVAIAVDNACAYGQISELKDQLAQEKLYLEDEIRSELNFKEVVGKSEALRRVLTLVETVAPTDSTVLIYGETGTGKELIARAVHDLSSRGSNAFVKLNCAAIPTGLLESELFGHERGAFTGAIAQRVGRFELAHRGTVFLDEIAEIPLELQPKLLRVLQEREFERLGSTRTLRTDARLIAATNRDLEAMVSEQKFRSDLYYRLNVFPVRVPALRERPEDIPLLVRHFVQQFSRRMNRSIDTIPSDTMTMLVGYHWPGNIRELQNVIERAVILSAGPILKVPTDELHPRSDALPLGNHGNKNLQAALDDAERQGILATLEKTNWKVAGPNGAAALLGMHRSTLQSRMQKLGIRVSRSGA
ncbi:MAG: transcriptional regulator, NifA subfamily, Fis Family [Bryobacterales bacterium]|nr:transcriptional regulator, NifA subfamily, Fis Family [Bryobacterales bacterium]